MRPPGGILAPGESLVATGNTSPILSFSSSLALSFTMNIVLACLLSENIT